MANALIDELVRQGALRMLAEAVQAEVEAYLTRFREGLDEHGHRLVVRNGYHQPREVTTTAGPIEVRMPRVNDKRVDPGDAEHWQHLRTTNPIESTFSTVRHRTRVAKGRAPVQPVSRWRSS